MEHDAEVHIFNGSERPVQIANAWVDLRGPEGRQRGLVAQWYEGKAPDEIAPEKSVRNVVYVQHLVKLTMGDLTTRGCGYRIGVQLGSGKKRRSRWAHHPARRRAYAGDNVAGDF